MVSLCGGDYYNASLPVSSQPKTSAILHRNVGLNETKVKVKQSWRNVFFSKTYEINKIKSYHMIRFFSTWFQWHWGIEFPRCEEDMYGIKTFIVLIKYLKIWLWSLAYLTNTGEWSASTSNPGSPLELLLKLYFVFLTVSIFIWE